MLLRRAGLPNMAWSRRKAHEFGAGARRTFCASSRLFTLSDSGNSHDGSNRASFRSVTPDGKVLQHLDGLGLGFVSRRRARVAVAKKFAEDERKERRENPKKRMSQAERAKRVVKTGKHGGSKAIDTVPLELKSRPYPFNKVGRAMVRIEDAADVRTDGIKTHEVAIIGRSNVGKSTLINNILGLDASYVQKSAVGDKPGVTQSLHLYAMGGEKKPLPAGSKGDSGQEASRKVFTADSAALVVVDMPGYGFAYMKEEQQQRCDALIKTFLGHRGKSLKRVLLLLDARHGFKKADVDFLRGLYTYLQTAHANRDPDTAADAGATAGVAAPIVGGIVVPNAKKVRWAHKWKLQVVLTKCDLLERADLARALQQVRLEMFDIIPSRMCSDLAVMPVSGLANRGTAALLQDLAALAPAPPAAEAEEIALNKIRNKRAKDVFDKDPAERKWPGSDRGRSSNRPHHQQRGKWGSRSDRGGDSDGNKDEGTPKRQSRPNKGKNRRERRIAKRAAEAAASPDDTRV